VGPSSPDKSLTDFVTSARSGKAPSIGTLGAGSASHLAAFAFGRATGINPTLVPYRSSSAVLEDLRAGHIDAALLLPLMPKDALAAMQLRALAVTSKAHSHLLPDVPRITELTPFIFDLASWIGIAAPAGTPKGVLDKMNILFRWAAATPEVRKAMEASGVTAHSLDVDETNRLIAFDTVIWAEIAKEAGLKPQ
ncbi:MAG TPA: tripartite tricarboxylate transporter substrate-binding protein, partial [Hyphomicrobiaceae bacterium]|nr:tripartite tricarboxylate transporter substrate-binding protein [Hyphomicrobiaceae bacterium]